MSLRMGDQELQPEEKNTDGRFSFDAVYNYLRYQQYPEGASKLEKNSLRRRSKYFKLEDEDLYYIGGGIAWRWLQYDLQALISPHLLGKASTSTPRLVVQQVDKRKRIIASIHNASHLGLNRTNDMVAQKYYWPGLFMDVRAYVSFWMCLPLNGHDTKLHIMHPLTTLYRWSPVIIANVATKSSRKLWGGCTQFQWSRNFSINMGWIW